MCRSLCIPDSGLLASQMSNKLSVLHALHSGASVLYHAAHRHHGLCVNKLLRTETRVYSSFVLPSSARKRQDSNGS